jgi:DNA polymerase-1
MWIDEGAPLPFDLDDLLVGFYASAEVGCFLSLGWPTPLYVLDLYAEFKNHLGGVPSRYGSGLLGACRHFRIHTGMTSESKDANRELAQRLEFSSEEREQLLDYCEGDVDCTFRLLQAMLPQIDLPRALLRGRYMAATAHIERTGIPLDMEILRALQEHWGTIKMELIKAVDEGFGVYEMGSFKEARWRAYCSRNRIPWPSLPSGKLDFKDETFRRMADLFPVIQPMRELRSTLSEMKLNALTVGKDARNRYMISPYGSITGRNQPSNTKAVFGPAKWIRYLIKPAEGMAVAYLDYEQQEFAIAGALSGDRNMMEAYSSGDPYLAFAKQAGAVPPDATKQTHAAERDLYKATVLAVQYGMGAESLAVRIGVSEAHSRALLDNHRNVYPDFWRWSDRSATAGMLGRPLSTVFGWRTFGRGDANPRTYRNFPAQANGAEMLRLAIIGLVESGIRVCAPVHDAVLIEAPAAEIETVVATAQSIMRAASRAVLSGFEVRTDAKIVKYPDRYDEPRGEAMWQKITQIIARRNVVTDHIGCGR